MARIRATRGVCIGVERHLAAGDVRTDLEPALIQYLSSIGAIEILPDEPSAPVKHVSADEPKHEPPPPAIKKEK